LPAPSKAVAIAGAPSIRLRRNPYILAMVQPLEARWRAEFKFHPNSGRNFLGALRF
jgi:hypothetical protein